MARKFAQERCTSTFVFWMISSRTAGATGFQSGDRRPRAASAGLDARARRDHDGARHETHAELTRQVGHPRAFDGPFAAAEPMVHVGGGRAERPRRRERRQAGQESRRIRSARHRDEEVLTSPRCAGHAERRGELPLERPDRLLAPHHGRYCS